MKINKLWVSKYKNIENIDLEFKTDLVTLLVGKNGLGKSNLIEILAILFRDLDLFENIEEFESWAYDPDNFECVIQYECYDDELLITLKEANTSIEIRPKGSDDYVFTELPFSEFLKNRNSKYLPKYIIGYYSGENKRIRDIILPHESLQFDILKKAQKSQKKTKPTIEENGLRRLFFTENHHSQLLLLTLVLFRSKERYKDKIDDLFHKYLGIVDIIDFEITFNNPDWNYTNIDKVNKGMDFLIANINSKEKIDFPFWNLKGKVDDLLTRFYNHQIENGSEPINYPNENEDDRSFVKEFLLFNSIDFKEFYKNISDYYDHPIKFFDALESTGIVEIFNKIKFKVVKKDVKDPIEFTQISEGEQQLLTILGLILVTGHEDCLFLLDEPDTHLNPKWQRDYSKLLKDFNLNGTNSHIIVATHSPLIIQSSEDADLFLHKKVLDKVIIDTNKEELQIHNWRIDQVLQSEYFGLESTRPTSLDEYMKVREEILTKSVISEADEELLSEYQNRFGVFPTGESIADIKALILVRKIANR